MAISGKNLMKSSVKGSDFLYDLVCKPCHLDDIAKPAFGYCINCDEHLCSMCFANHKKPRPLRHHKLLDSSDMPTTQTLDDKDTTVDEGPSDSLTTPCGKHSEEYIKFYCNDHKMTFCSVCVTLNHRSCKVDYIPDVSKFILNSDMLQEIIDKAESVENKCISMKHGISRDTQQTMDSLKRSLTVLKKYRSDINKRLDIMVEEITQKITDLKDEKSIKIKTTEAKCEFIRTDVKLRYDTLNKMKKSKQPNQLFIQLHQARISLDEYEDSLQTIESKHNLEEYQFIQNTAIQKILEEENALGTISSRQKITPPTPLNMSPQRPRHAGIIKPKLQQVLPPTSSNVHPQKQPQTYIKPKMEDEILVETSRDKSDCWITGMTEIIPDILLLADYNNKSIKLVDVKRKAVTSALSLEVSPNDITIISTTKVAVTVPDEKYIQFVTVSNNMEKSHRINTDGKCLGICYHQDKLIVTFRDPVKLEILDMKGKVIKSITTDTTGKHIFTDPYYVRSTDQYIYVSDFSNNNIIMIDFNLNILSTCYIMSPLGMTLLKDMSSLVCSYYGFKICQVTEDVQNCTAILENLEDPVAICVNHQQNKIYISRCHEYIDRKIVNTILVWNI